MKKDDTINLTSSWGEIKDKIKRDYIFLTDYDLRYEVGREQELLKRLGKKMRKSKKEVKRLIESYSY